MKISKDALDKLRTAMELKFYNTTASALAPSFSPSAWSDPVPFVDAWVDQTPIMSRMMGLHWYVDRSGPSALIVAQWPGVCTRSVHVFPGDTPREVARKVLWLNRCMLDLAPPDVTRRM
jgi:hypothetical protein